MAEEAKKPDAAGARAGVETGGKGDLSAILVDGAPVRITKNGTASLGLINGAAASCPSTQSARGGVLTCRRGRWRGDQT